MTTKPKFDVEAAEESLRQWYHDDMMDEHHALTLAALAHIREQHEEIELLKGELKSLEDGSGFTNVLDQYESQLKAERDEVARLESLLTAAEAGAAQQQKANVGLSEEIVRLRDKLRRGSE